MAKQTVNLGVAPSGIGGDSFRAGADKLQKNDNEIYTQLGANTQGVLPAGLPVDKGGTGATTAAAARTNLGLTLTTTQFDVTAGRVLKVGDFGIGGVLASPILASTINTNKFCHFFSTTDAVALAGQYAHGMRIARSASAYCDLLLPYAGGARPNRVALRSLLSATVVEQILYSSKDPIIFTTAKTESNGWLVSVESTGELRSRGFIVDANGFYKSASPIVLLFADRIELNDEAQLQEITFEKLGVGEYLIKGSTGLAQEGWYVETPKDANGNVLFSVIYSTLENGDISVQTYKKKFDLETASIVADLTKPVDIADGRWIDIRLHELPQPEIEYQDDFESATPPDFQPTNLAQAIAEALNHDIKQ